MDNTELYKKELEELEQEHKDLNEIIDDPDAKEKFSEFTLQKLKKRKLLVKDKIKLAKQNLHPDILA
jgi:hypothetical protein